MISRSLLLAAACLLSASLHAALSVTSVTLDGQGASAVLSVKLSAPGKATLEHQGSKAILKIKGAAAAAGLKLPEGAGPVQKLRQGDHAGSLWIVADLKGASTALLKSSGDTLSVSFAPKGAAKAPAPEKEAAADAEAPLEALAPSGANQTARIVDVALGEAGGESQVVVSSDSPASYKPSVSEGGKKISITFRNASLSWAASDIAGNDPSLKSLKARQISVHGESQVVIELSLKEKVPYAITRDQNQVMVNLGRSEAPGAARGKGNADMKVSVDFEAADMIGVLRNIAEQAGFESKLSATILALADKDRLVTYNAVNRPLKEVLYGILTQNGKTFIFRVMDNQIFFGTQDEISAMKAGEKRVTKFYAPLNQQKLVLEKLVMSSGLDITENLAPMIDDPSDADKIMVTGFEGDVANTMKALRRWDVPETGEAAASDDRAAEEPGSGSRKTKIYALKYLDATNSGLLDAGIRQVIPADAIVSQAFVYNFDSSSRKLLVTSKLKYIRAIDKLLEHLDVRVPQVRIEGKIIEVSQSDAKSLGIKWGYAQQNGTQKTSLSFAGAQGGAAIATFADTQALSQLNATLDALVTQDRANIISSPSLTSKDGVAASIEGTDTVVVQSAVVTNTISGPQTTFSFTSQDVPIHLAVTPKISEDEGKVEMRVDFTLSSVTGDSVNGSPVPTTKQTILTTVMVSNGETAVIGGLTNDSWTKAMSGVPVLGDIPLLGLLFKGERVRKIKKDVIIFITPTIVED